MAFQPRFWKKLNDEQKIQVLSYLYTGEFLEVEPRPVEWVGEFLLKKLIDEKVTRQTIYNLIKWLETTEEGVKEYNRLKEVISKGLVSEKEEQENIKHIKKIQIYIMWRKRDIIEFTLEYFDEAFKDGKLKVDEILTFINELLKRLGLDKKVVIQ